MAFADEETRLALNAITHPAIGIAMIQARDALADTDDIVVLAIPLLTALHRETVKLHKVVVVDAPTDVALERLLSQRGFDRADAEARIRSQISREERVKEADYVLDNSGDRAALEAEVAELWDWLQAAADGAADRTPDLSHPPGSLIGSCPNSRSSPPSSPRATSPRPSPGWPTGVRRGDAYQTLQGITGSGKTATIAWMIEQVQRPTLIIEPNKSLAAQLSSELRELFPKNRVEFFVSYYDYYQPEAYLPTTDTYIEKDSSINDEIDRLRHATTSSLLMRRDVIVVASVSCIYGLGSPDEYRDRILGVKVGEQVDQRDMLRRLVDLQYARNDVNLVRGTFRARGDTVEIHPAYEEQALRVELFGDTVDRIVPFDVLTGEMGEEMEDVAVYAATHYVTGDDIIQRAVGSIEVELRERLQEFEKEGKLLEAQRLRVRTEHDLEMLAETGVCSGVENYSRHLDGRAPGETPYTLLDFFPKDYLCVIDESHVAVPQLHGQYAGDKSRKDVLVEHGFRLPSARDNRPLRFEEFVERVPQTRLRLGHPGGRSSSSTPTRWSSR